MVDVFSLDAQRQLVIVRRDNVEHLLMIGGPNDLVVEPQILRGAANGANSRESASPQRPWSPPWRLRPTLRPPRAALAFRSPRPAAPRNRRRSAPPAAERRPARRVAPPPTDRAAFATRTAGAGRGAREAAASPPRRRRALAEPLAAAEPKPAAENLPPRKPLAPLKPVSRPTAEPAVADHPVALPQSGAAARRTAEARSGCRPGRRRRMS